MRSDHYRSYADEAQGADEVQVAKYACASSRVFHSGPYQFRIGPLSNLVVRWRRRGSIQGHATWRPLLPIVGRWEVPVVMMALPDH